MALSTAKRFVAEGARVYVTGRRQSELDKAVREIGGDVTAVQGDIASNDDLDRLYGVIREGAASSVSLRRRPSDADRGWSVGG